MLHILFECEQGEIWCNTNGRCHAKDGLVDAFDQVAMGTYADATAKKYSISRQEQDAFAIESYRRSAAAWESGILQGEVIPVAVQQRKGS